VIFEIEEFCTNELFNPATFLCRLQTRTKIDTVVAGYTVDNYFFLQKENFIWKFSIKIIIDSSFRK
jgi:hypothetical protein